MQDIKQESECCFCFSKADLFSLFEPYNFKENVEIYSTMIAVCFQIELSSYIEECNRYRYLICKNCVFRLRDATLLQSQVRIACDRLEAERCTKKDDEGDILNEHSHFIEMKDHVIKYISKSDNTETCVNVKSEALSSNENVFKMKPMKIVNMEENIGGFDAKSRPAKLGSHEENLHSNKRKTLHLDRKTCKYCNKVYRYNASLLEHEKIHLNMKDFICDYCKKKFKLKQSLENHILSHMHIKCFKCDLCDKSFVSKLSLSQHRKMSHFTRLPCNICSKTFYYKRDLENHVLIHSDIRNYKCDVCEKSYKTKDILSRHKKSHKKELPSKISREAFYYKRELEEQVLTNSSTKNYKCDMCEETFINTYRLYKHKKSHTNGNLICDICKREFKFKRSLQNHILSHLDIKRFKCDLCDKRFVSKNVLSSHKSLNHSIIYSCDICSKTFYSKRTFENHALTHSDLINNMCEKCGKAFPTRLKLNRHKALHKKNKTCKYCNKAFAVNSSLLKHLKVHLNIKDFICDYCKKEFTYKCNLRKHIVSHMGVKDKKCEICGKCFISKELLSRHEKLHFVKFL